MKNLYIIGSSGLAREIAQLVKQINNIKNIYNFLGYISDNKEEIGKEILYGQILGDDSWLINKKENCSIIIAIGLPKVRAKLFMEYSKYDYFDFPNIIHPTTIFDWDTNSLGQGNILTAGCIFTNNIRIGNNNLFNLNCTIGHDVIIVDNNVINPTCSISGNVEIGNSNLLGTGAQILEKIKIGNDTIIGGASLVRKPVMDQTRVAGVPAKEI
ncbi:MAG: putative acetyltransferase EpsM [Ignavibacteriaceae bacterium]|nr:putative acetyltransferase EpsM [Ignavibacteriaceae bacterium]